jgi:Zn-dependent M28 family amino/carboxypeptidase
VVSASSPVSAPTAVVTAAIAGVSTPDAAQRTRLKADVAKIAIRRAPGSSGWKTVQTLIKERLVELGYSPQLEPFEPGGVNVLASKLGSKSPQEIVILSAHYDHLQGCDGADDNASGVATVLEAARFFQSKTLERTVLLAFWDREESGLEGSLFHAKAAKARGDRITQMISLDGVGFASSAPGSQRFPPGLEALLPDIHARAAKNDFKADFITAIGDSDSAETVNNMEKFGTALNQPTYGLALSVLKRLALSDAARSDHASFWLHGYPAILVTDTADFRNPRYHCGNGPDSAASLDYEFLNRVTSVVISATDAAASTR